MRILKIVLSIAALIVGALATAMTGGLFNVPPQAVGLVMGLAGFVSVLGIQPFPVTDGLARAMRAASVLLTSFQVYHATVVTSGGNPHPWLWAGVGIVGVVAGIVGKSPIVHDSTPALPTVAK